MAGLRRLNVAHAHAYIPDPRALAPLYHASDLCIVTSRQEGGPKAVLEAMSCGTALVSSRVGMATDLVCHGDNGWLADVEDVEALAHWSAQVLRDGAPLSVRDRARATAEAHAFAVQVPLWDRFLAGFVERRAR
jgi:glycosyltransferase involved in cell wall biosynthesis